MYKYYTDHDILLLNKHLEVKHSSANWKGEKLNVAFYETLIMLLCQMLQHDTDFNGGLFKLLTCPAILGTIRSHSNIRGM